VKHWDLVARYDLDYFAGQISKYVMRWRNKNGIEDLYKAQHFMEKYLEVMKNASGPAPSIYPTGGPFPHGWGREEVFDSLNLDTTQRRIVTDLISYSVIRNSNILKLCSELLNQYVSDRERVESMLKESTSDSI